MRVHKTLISPAIVIIFLLASWFFMLFLSDYISAPPVGAEDETMTINFPESPQPKKVDKRLTILQNYLSQFNSPLKDHAQDFLDAADTYGVDWRLIPAIAGVESTFGKRIPGGHDPEYSSYNGWGWGVYGDKVLKFGSWREAIFAVTKGVKKGYIDQGLTDPFEMNKKYASSPYWGEHVSWFLMDMDGYISSNPIPDQYIIEPQNIDDTVIFQNDTYLKVNDTRFEMKFIE